MIAFPLILLAAATPAATPAAPVKCDAKPFTLNKPAPAQKGASAKAGQKAEPPKPIEKPSCNHPGHQPGHKH
jgi:hypothetical protein